MSQNAQKQQSSQLWMGFISSYMNEFFLANAFIKMGVTPISIKIVKKFGATPHETTYGFIHFRSESDALEALHLCNNKPIPNSNPVAKFKLNHVSSSANSMSGPPEFTAWVGDLPKEVDDSSLFKLFGDKFPSLKMNMGPTGQSKGFGFLTFGSENEYKHCMKTMNGYKWYGKALKLNSSYRETKTQSKQLSDQQAWQDFTSLSKDYYPHIPYDLSCGHSFEIPAFSRYYTKNELELIDHEVKVDYSTLNSARSHQDHCLWDPLLVSGYCEPDPDLYECTTFSSVC
ncbi:hypothetical protein M8J76_003864 [Diaphorina citri]|nr:hypothetical protein M8J76_003864 [Diaphorina citri]